MSEVLSREMLGRLFNDQTSPEKALPTALGYITKPMEVSDLRLLPRRTIRESGLF
jgi:hypothetical protein